MALRDKGVLPSASTLDRVKYCPASHALPWTRRVSPYAERGDLVHEYVLRKARLEPFEAPEEHRAYLESINLEAIPEGEYEVRMAYNVATGLGRHVHGSPWVQENEIGGVADIIGVREIGGVRHAYVADLKTGLGHHVPPVQDCLQVRFYALAAARTMGVENAVAEIIRVSETGRVTTEPSHLDGWALDAIALELSDIVQAVRRAVAVVEGGGTPQVTTGLHCKFCQAFSACPEQRALAVLIGQDPNRVEKEALANLTPQTARAAYLRTMQVLEVANRVKNAIYGFARQNPIDLGNGLVLGPVSIKRSTLDGEVTHKVLGELFGRDQADSAMEFKTSQAAIRRMLKACGKPITPGLREVMGVLRDRGGIQEHRHERVDVHKQTLKELEEHEE